MKSKKLLLTLATSLLTGMGVYAQEGETINIDRIVGQGYGAQTETVDFTAAKTYLGVPDGAYVICEGGH